MAQHFFQSMTQTLLVCMIGGLAGWQYALRGLAPAARPPASSQFKACLLACAGGSVVCLAFEAWLIAAYPLAPNPQLAIVQLLSGAAIAKWLARRDLKPAHS